MSTTPSTRTHRIPSVAGCRCSCRRPLVVVITWVGPPMAGDVLPDDFTEPDLG